MANIKKREYYLKNKEERITYQKKYYYKNRDWIKRKKELKLEEEPERALRQKEYNKNYYIKNKEKIKEQRLKKRLNHNL
tara:strand:+ start:109 stop:345 length:237 start_codon:yes stop_codon:yes gene_type:complete